MIAIACDHGGYQLKQWIMKNLPEGGYEDLGCDSEQPVDYPIFAEKVCRGILDGKYEKGILICGTGIGMSLAANAFPGIRAAVCGDCYSTEFTRRHNNANVMCIGARTVGSGLAAKMVEIFLSTPYEGGKHAHRLEMVERLRAGETLSK